MLAVVIVNFNAGTMLGDAVASVVEDVDRVIVVDNASADGSAEVVAHRWGGDPRVAVIRRLSNGGFSRACNDGVRALGGRSAAPGEDGRDADDLVLFLNPDARCLPGCVDALTREIRSDPGIGVVGGMLVDAGGCELAGGRRGTPSPWPALVRATGLWRLARRWPRAFPDLHRSHLPLPAGPEDVGAVSGACLMIRRSALEKVNGFDDRYFLHCEDLDLCARVAKSGWRVRFVPAARAWHAVRGTTGGRTLGTEWHKHRGMVRYYRTHLGAGHPAPMRWAFAAGIWARFVAVWPVCAAASLRRARGARRHLGDRRAPGRANPSAP